jgi:probable HAF family extracellular repeat protein
MAPFTSLFTPNGTIIDFGTLGRSDSFGSANNRYGQVTGYSAVSSGANHVLLYSTGGMTDLGTLGGAEGHGEGIN